MLMLHNAIKFWPQSLDFHLDAQNAAVAAVVVASALSLVAVAADVAVVSVVGGDVALVAVAARVNRVCGEEKKSMPCLQKNKLL